MTAKIRAFLQTVDRMSPYHLLVLNSYTHRPVADANSLNAFSKTMLKVDHFQFH